MRTTRFWLVVIAGVLMLTLAGCDASVGEDSASPPSTLLTEDAPDPSGCIVPTNLFADGGVGKDGIPSLTNPPLINAARATYLADDSRVIGLVIDGIALAVPHNILWWHEIVNFRFSRSLAVTYCPLTGSSMAFDRASAGGGEFGVSGLLFQNNLTMYDRTNDESLWPQMSRQAGCGARVGTRLEMFPVVEMTWAGWQSLHPDTKVVSDATGHDRNYTPSGYPYGGYEDPNDPSLLFRMPVDGRRLPKERVLGIPDLDGGIAFPFFELDEQGPVRVVHETVGGASVVVFWDRERVGAMAYRPFHDGQPLTFEARDGRLLDLETGSEWRLDGLAVSGPLAGERLEPVAEAYVAFWFAWAAFQPQTRLWDSE
ncbi:MAG: DUF3179 domain-containing protein [Rhodothermales bacterium]